MNRIILFLIACGLMALIDTGSAKADIVYTLNYDSCSGGCGANGQGSSDNNFGFVDISQVDLTHVSVTVELNTSVALDTDFVNTGNGRNHEPLAFNVDKSVTISSVSPSTYFAVGPTADAISGLGSFSDTIACTSNCPPGASGADQLGDTLTFTASNASGLSVNDFTQNGSGFYFAADVLGPAGNTGEVAVTGPGTQTSNVATPEPSTFAVFGAALIGLALLRRRSIGADRAGLARISR